MNEKSIFNNARAMPDAEAREAYLKQVCGDDHLAMQRIGALLAAHFEETDFLQSPPIEVAATRSLAGSGESVGSQIGPYKLLKQIGEGGMGTVYMAEQTHPIKRKVAVKVVKPGMDTREVLARFEAERQALALMDHPGIARVFDCGSTDNGRPYFVMELVKGLPITQYCDDKNLTPKQRLQLFVQVCQAVQHAHQKGIIHRDLKPSNILVAEFDDQPVPKVIDFGLAKAMSQTLTEKTLFTQHGQILGTIEYMSPEQARANQLDMDTRSDIYSLGVVLYELLAGVTPFDRKRLRSAAWDEMLRIIREEEPPRPSLRLSVLESAPSVAAHRHTQPKKLSSILRNELDWIVMKSMEKDRNRRYETANGLARDLQRFLEGEAVEARPPSMGYLLSRFVKRNQKPLLAGLAFAIVLALVATTIIWIANERQLQAQARSLVKSLSTSETSHVSSIIDDLQNYAGRTRKDLESLFAESMEGSDARLHTGMALVIDDDSKLKFVSNQLFEIRPEQFRFVCEFLENRRQELMPDLWRRAEGTEEEPEIRFRAVCALATFDPSSDRWSNNDLVQFVSAQLSGLSPSDVGVWLTALRPVGANLTNSLSGIYRDSDRSQSSRVIAAGILADYLQENADALFDLMLDGVPDAFRILFDVLAEHHPQRAIQLGLVEAEKDFSNVVDPMEKESLIHRQANAGIMLIRLGAKLDAGTNSPSAAVRNYIVHGFRPNGGSADSLISAIFTDDEVDNATVRSLLLSLGEFDATAIPEIEKGELTNRLMEMFETRSDPGVHGAVDWLLRQWNENTRLENVRAKLQLDEKRLKEKKFDEYDWYINTQGQTFTVVRLHDFPMGSPESEPGRMDTEKLHTRHIDRRVAVANTEVTKAQWRRFFESQENEDYVDLEQEKEVIQVCHTDDSAMVYMTLFEAAEYCNWLSAAEGIDEDQWCYEPNRQGVYGPGMKARESFWEKTGYRLPTEAEWEFLCRAETATAMSWGDSEAHALNYAHFSSGSLWKTGKGGLLPTASLKPNDFGLFDMHGNAYEWCFDFAEDYPAESAVDAPKAGSMTAFKNRIVRGGAYDTYSVRSAGRLEAPPLARPGNGGFRPVRTFPY